MKKNIKSNEKKAYTKPELIKVGGITDNTLGNYGGTNDPGGSQNGGTKV